MHAPAVPRLTADKWAISAAAARTQVSASAMCSHSHLVIDADGGWTRLLTYAQSTLDLAVGDYGLNMLKIPGTNGIGSNYDGIPGFYLTTFTGLGNDQGANPFEFRDNQFTADINLSWVKAKHAFKFGYTYYHFDLNHFQPTSGGQPNTPRGGFTFQGGMTCAPYVPTSRRPNMQHHRIPVACRLPIGSAQQWRQPGDWRPFAGLQSQRICAGPSMAPMRRTRGQ